MTECGKCGSPYGHDEDGLGCAQFSARSAGDQGDGEIVYAANACLAAAAFVRRRHEALLDEATGEQSGEATGEQSGPAPVLVEVRAGNAALVPDGWGRYSVAIWLTWTYEGSVVAEQDERG
jgi:hypothetical protein